MIKRPLFWHQGLFLQPQHFQLEDLYFQSLLTPLHKFLQPHFWGVREMDLQMAGLNNFSFNLLSGEFLFQDNTFVNVPGNAIVENRSFQGAWEDGGKPFQVFIGIKNYNENGENVTVVPKLSGISEVTTRFVTLVDTEEVTDTHGGGPQAQVKRLYHVLKVFWETEVDRLGDYTLIPIARLKRDGEEIRIAENFIPPVITTSGSPILTKLILEVRDQLASRAHQLEGYKRERGIHSAEFGARDMVYLLALRSLNRYIPLLFHLTESKQVHPWTVFGLLRQIVGELSTFSGEISVMGETGNGLSLFSGYDHRDLWRCFSEALSLITRILDEITSGPEYVIRLAYDGTYFAADLPPAIFEGKNRFYMVLETEEDPKLLRQSLETGAKLGAREALPILIARALPGIPLEHLPAPPQELPRRSGSVYFSIDHHSEQWAQVQKGKNLALYWDEAPGDLKAELMVVGKS